MFDISRRELGALVSLLAATTLGCSSKAYYHYHSTPPTISAPAPPAARGVLKPGETYPDLRGTYRIFPSNIIGYSAEYHPLDRLFFLEQSKDNRTVTIHYTREIVNRLGKKELEKRTLVTATLSYESRGKERVLTLQGDYEIAECPRDPYCRFQNNIEFKPGNKNYEAVVKENYTFLDGLIHARRGEVPFTLKKQ